MSKTPFEVSLEGAPPVDGQHRMTAMQQVVGETVSLDDVLRVIVNEPDATDLLGATPSDISIGQKLRRARRLRGMTQADVAESTNLPQSMISDVERGKGRDGPSLRVLETIARALGLDLALVQRDEGHSSVDLLACSVSDTTSATEIGRKASTDDLLTFLRAVLDDRALLESFGAVRNYLTKIHASFALNRYAAKTPVCQFWRMDPYAEARFSAPETTVFVPIHGSEHFYAYSLKDDSIEKSGEVYVVGGKETLCAQNKSAKPVSILSMSALNFLSMERKAAFHVA